jgi:hypothetical protein
VRTPLAAKSKAPAQGHDPVLKRADAAVAATMPRRRGGKR